MSFASRLQKHYGLQNGGLAKFPVARKSRARMAMNVSVMGLLFASSAFGGGGNPSPPNCYEDAMLVFDASGSMSGMEEWGSSSLTTRIDDARKALAESLPRVTPYRRLGLMTYGPGPVGRCNNIILNMRPALNAGPRLWPR